MTTKFKSNDPLQALLREALHKQKVEIKPQPRDPMRAFKDKHSIYDSPAWKPGRLVALVHVSDNGERTKLGIFQEHINERAHGRRFVPWTGPEPMFHTFTCIKAIDPARRCDCIQAAEEIVHGRYWLEVRQPPVHIESSRELHELRERFEELLESYN